MRFILNEYLSSLKEDKELDAFVEELAKSMKYIPTSKIQKGRQFGVDISAVGSDEDGKRKLFLFVIKQGNFSRKTWDSGNVNDIRPSIIEIFDVYMKTRIVKPYDRLPIKIIVTCNGYLEQTVQDNWTNFVNQHTSESIEFDFWGIDKLCLFAEAFQMQEEILTPKLALEFRRALSFIDLPDYNLSHLYNFFEELLPNNEIEKINDKQIFKKLRLANLCLSIIVNWCEKSDNLKPAYIASERIILNLWKWLSVNRYIEKKGVVKEYVKILTNWKELNHKYLNKTYEYFKVQDGLSIGVPSHNEYCILTFEQIGIVAIMGLFQLWETELVIDDPKSSEIAKNYFSEANAIAECLKNLILQNPSSLSPKYDEHCIEIDLSLQLLCSLGRYNIAVPWLRDLINRIILNYNIDNLLPLLHSDYTKLNSGKSEIQETSFLIPMLAEWCIILKQIDMYRLLKDFIQRKLPKLNLQMWFPDKDVENYLYSSQANNYGTTMINIKLPDNYLLMEMNISEEKILLNAENNFSYNQLGLTFLNSLASRHFRTYPFPNSRRKFLRSVFCFQNSLEV